VGALSEDGAGLGVARIVLASAEGAMNNDVAAKLRVTKKTVCKWRSHFVRMRLDGPTETRRPGAPRSITDARISCE
jgi:transposase